SARALSPRALRPDLPVEVDDAFARAGERGGITAATAFVGALTAALPVTRMPPRPAPTTVGSDAAASRGLQPAGPRSTDGRRRSRWVALGGGLVALLTAGALFWTGGDGRHAAVATTST